MRVGRVLLRLTDTAGIREAGDAIEALGVARSEQAAREAELALFVCDASQPLTDEDPPRHRSGQMRPAQSGPVQQIRPARRRLAGRAAV